MQIQGTAHVFGRDVDTDAIIAARYLSISDPQELGLHCMEDLDPGFVGRVKQGDIIVAGQNFGCGSSREHAPLAIRACGIEAVVATCFARIFYRNAINIGLPILECPQAVEAIQDGHDVRIDTNSGTVWDVTTDQRFQAQPFPEFVDQIIAQGGLLQRTRKLLEQRR